MAQTSTWVDTSRNPELVPDTSTNDQEFICNCNDECCCKCQYACICKKYKETFNQEKNDKN